MTFYTSTPTKWPLVAARAYAAYGASTGDKNFRGDPMIEVAPDPARWAGWKPDREAV